MMTIVMTVMMTKMMVMKIFNFVLAHIITIYAFLSRCIDQNNHSNDVDSHWVNLSNPYHQLIDAEWRIYASVN